MHVLVLVPELPAQDYSPRCKLLLPARQQPPVTGAPPGPALQAEPRVPGCAGTPIGCRTAVTVGGNEGGGCNVQPACNS
jgi:hypothetical protein